MWSLESLIDGLRTDVGADATAAAVVFAHDDTGREPGAAFSALVTTAVTDGASVGVSKDLTVATVADAGADDTRVGTVATVAAPARITGAGVDFGGAATGAGADSMGTGASAATAADKAICLEKVSAAFAFAAGEGSFANGDLIFKVVAVSTSGASFTMLNLRLP